MDEFPQTVVVTENKEDIKKMQDELSKKEKKYLSLYKTGEVISSVSTPIFIGSLLSPLDIEGPVVEIVSGVTLAVGAILKTVAKNELEEIKVIRTNGTVDYQNISYKLDKETEESLKNTVNKIIAMKENQKEAKKTL